MGYLSVYAALQDDTSRIAFDHRLKYYHERDRKHLWEMFDRLEEIDKSFRLQLADEPKQSILDLVRLKNGELTKKSRIVLYGCGAVSETPLILLRHFGLDADFYCDRNPSLQGKLHFGLLVLSPEQLISEYSDAMVAIASFDHATEIYSDLTRLGFNPAQVFYSRVFPEQIYFGFPEFVFSEHEVYLDCGVCDGLTIKQFHDRVDGKYDKVYGFEPDNENYQCSARFIQEMQIPKVALMNFGVYSMDGVLSFTSETDNVSSHISEDGDLSISVKRIDDMIGDSAPTFIKMDIEGAELEALHGAENTIRNNKPKLAICLYHKPEDIPLIPQYIHSIVPEYRMWIRPYEIGIRNVGDVHLGETILYACI